jgi:hypothetical protein
MIFITRGSGVSDVQNKSQNKLQEIQTKVWFTNLTERYEGIIKRPIQWAAAYLRGTCGPDEH